MEVDDEANDTIVNDIEVEGVWLHYVIQLLYCKSCFNFVILNIQSMKII